MKIKTLKRKSLEVKGRGKERAIELEGKKNLNDSIEEREMQFDLRR